ncbi:metallophosphoesterase [Franzmannia qiaohouensis]|uniref:Metallophosphoesterase n=1 Tax=Franzmannia qiaohouensis TaxID=1329370 RepID=A0ABU1HJB0_9GAMM|nr:metallophosphoesterase [Halomonas qiaohouensis]MDR5907565.1 metallophosphoesterase [Halomonas qiaohouensis]
MLRIAIATDLHYVASGTSAVPQVCLDGTNNDPMEALLRLLRQDERGADLLICPGDITDRACAVAFRYGWNMLLRLKALLNAEHLIAATGNHEVSSRVGDEHRTPGNAELAIDTLDHLLDVSNYPAIFDNDDKRWVYWGRGYETVYGSNWVVVTINSCHYHNSTMPNEYERGRIGDVTLKELMAHIGKISSNKSYEYKVIVLHHPPVAHEEIGVELGKTPMFNGDGLIQAIEEVNSDWLIIHGHKHHHRLKKCSGSDYAPVLLGAGSFGALITGGLSNRTKNQFYILELQTKEDEVGEHRLRGRIETLYWDGTEWSKCVRTKDGIPDGCGFQQGSNISMASLAHTVKTIILNSKQPFLRWEEVSEESETLNYLSPSEVPLLLNKLDLVGVEVNMGNGDFFPAELWVVNDG